MAATLITLLFVLFATVRTTRAIVVDKITEPLRAWLIRKNGAHGWFTYLFHCGWCTGFWIALPAAAIAWWATPLGTLMPIDWWFGVPAVWFTLAYLTGFIMTKENN